MVLSDDKGSLTSKGSLSTKVRSGGPAGRGRPAPSRTAAPSGSGCRPVQGMAGQRRFGGAGMLAASALSGVAAKNKG